VRCRYAHTVAGGGDDGGDGGGGTHAFAAKPAELINSATDTEPLLPMLAWLLPPPSALSAVRVYGFFGVCVRVHLRISAFVCVCVCVCV